MIDVNNIKSKEKIVLDPKNINDKTSGRKKKCC